MAILIQNERVISPVISNDILELSAVQSASGAVANFTTDMTEDLIEVVCDIQYSQASGTPTPQDQKPITVYTSLNLSHSGADTSNPNVTNIPLGQTVAKATLNVTTGVLTIDKKGISYNGSENWIEQNGTYRVMAPADGQYDGGSTPCIDTSNMFMPALSGNNTIRREWANLVIVTNEYASLSDFTTALSNTNLEVVYPVSSPLVIQLSATQITALLNENNIWCDTGDTSVKFILSVGEYVNQNV